MHTNRFWLLWSKKLSGEISAGELIELEELLKSSELDIPEEEINAYWNGNHFYDSKNFNLIELNNKWNQFEKKLQPEHVDEITIKELQPRNYLRKIIPAVGIAASILFLAGFFFFFRSTTASEARNNEILGPEKGFSKLVLPDGTKVWLNSHSRLTYKNDFGKDKREVKLSGEAFFDVVKDKAHPFVVRTNTIQLKVLGTAFNVRSYEDEDVTETSLIHGKIQVTLVKNSDKEIILKPTEKLIINNKAAKFGLNTKESANKELPLMSVGYIHQSETDSLPSEALWMDNTLAFDSESFEQVANRLELWYGVKIAINNTALKDLKFTGRFKDESLETALRALQATSDFKFAIRNKHVTIN